MRKLFFKYYLLLIFLSLHLLSCSGNKGNTQQDPEEYISSLIAQDTATVLSLGDKFFSLLEAEHYDQAFSMLSELDEQQRLAYLTEETQEKLQTLFSHPKIVSHKLIGLNFRKPLDNFSRYFIYTSEDGSDKDEYFRFSLSPVKIDDVWYLTIRMNPL